jgi:hypothetical protein
VSGAIALQIKQGRRSLDTEIRPRFSGVVVPSGPKPKGPDSQAYISLPLPRLEGVESDLLGCGAELAQGDVSQTRRT